jgi:hypothetical protein
MLEEIIQHQYDALLQSIYFDVLVGKNFFNAFVKVLGKWNSVCGMVVLVNVLSFAFFVYSATCIQIPGSSILTSIRFYQTIEITENKNRGGAA